MKKIAKIAAKILSGFLIILSIVTFFGCGEEANERTFFSMDTVMTVSYYGDEAFLNGCGDIISDLDKKLSVTGSESLVYALNNSGTPITDSECVELIKKCKEISVLTGGTFDVTVYPIVSAWGFTKEENRVPTEEEISALLGDVGYEKITVGESVTLQGGSKIDLGGIAKGYCSDKIKSYLLSCGVTSGIINLGGNVMAIGDKKGKPWKVAIADPEGNGYVGIVPIKDKAVVTSGIYERYFVSDGVTYGHIIDPKMGYPVNNELLSVTVIGDSGTLCDALSTALFVMGQDKAIKFLREHTVFKGVLVTKNGNVYISEGLEMELKGKYVSAGYVTI